MAGNGERCVKKAPKDRWESQISGVRQEAEYLTIEELKHKYSVNHLCDILGIARSSYYKWLKREPSESELKRLRLMRAIEGIHEAFGGIYGYRRMTIFLNFFRSAKVNHKCVHHLMKTMGITAVIRRKRKNYVPHKATHVAENILNREFHAEKPMEKLLTDVTEFRLTNGKKRYLSAIYDLGTKKIITYQMSNCNDNTLVLHAMKQILSDVKPETTFIHSDRGSQYTSHTFNKMIKENKRIHSMSRVSKCIDNDPMEGFWGTLKVEMFNLDTFDTPAYLDRKIKTYIAFFNNERVTLDMGLAIPTEEKILQMVA